MNKKVVLWSSIVVSSLGVLTLLYFWFFTDLFKSGVRMDIELEVRPADVVRNDVVQSWDEDFVIRMNRALYKSSKETDMERAIEVLVANSREEDLYQLFNTSDADEVKSKIRSRVYNTVDGLIMRLKSRCDLLGLRTVNIEHVENSNRIRVSLFANDGSEQVQKTVERIFTASAKLEFWEVGTAIEAAEVRAAILKNNMLAGINHNMDAADYPYCVLTANYSDIEKINDILAEPSNKSELPFGMKLAWEHKSIDNDTYGDYRLLVLNGSAPLMKGDGITDATAQSVDPSRGAGFEVSMNMDSESTRKWANITANHVGEQIAIVMDGVVYSAPTVLGRIDGASSITGNFTKEEAESLAITLDAPLPVSPRVTSFEVSN